MALDVAEERPTALGIVMKALNSRCSESHLPASSSVFNPVWEGKQNAATSNEVPLEIELHRVDFVAAPSFESPGEHKMLLELEELDKQSREKFGSIIKNFLHEQTEGQDTLTMDFDGWVGLATCQRLKMFSLVKKNAHRFSHRLVVAILRCCMRIHLWEPIYAFLDSGRVSANECPEVIEFILEQGNIPALCVCLNRVADLRPSHRRDILTMFLSDSDKLKKPFFVLREIFREVSLCVMDEAARLKGIENVAQTGYPQEFKRLSLLSKKGRNILARSGLLQNWLKPFENPKCWLSQEEHRRWAQKIPMQVSENKTPKKKKRKGKAKVQTENAAQPTKQSKQAEQAQEDTLIFHSLLSDHISSNESDLVRQVSDTAVGMAAAFDLFTASELALHCFLCTDIDEAVLSMIISEMSSRQVYKIFHYLNKWLVKYANGVVPSREARLEGTRRFVPSHDTVVQWVGVILEGRFASFVLSPGLKKELLVSRGIVDSLVEQTKLVSLEGITKHLVQKDGLPAATPGSGISDHIIEYLSF